MNYTKRVGTLLFAVLLGAVALPEVSAQTRAGEKLRVVYSAIGSSQSPL